MPKTVLFVDDEPRVLEGLQRLLRPQRKVWSMRFAESGAQALGILEQEKVDVVVTDMRMPGMDGAELLRQICERYPGVARIVLSGQFDQEAGMRAAPFAHQFLVKPCDPAQLISAVERSGDCTCEGMPDQAIRDVVNSIGSLPSPPETCLRLLDLIQQPDVPLEKVAKVIDQDVALAAKVMQMVNSAFFSLPREVHTVHAAVSVLGLDVLRQLVISLEIQKRYHQLPQLPHFSLQEFDRHSRLVAKIASILPADSAARKATMAALLHDTGKLVLATQRTADFHRACQLAVSERVSLHVAEHQIFGTTHAEIGAYLLHVWGFPQEAVRAIATHHRPVPPATSNAVPPGLDLAAIIHVANAIAIGIDQPPGELPATLDLAYAEALGILPQIPSWRAAAQDLIP